MSRTPIYFDNNATTQPAPEVITAMLPYLTERWGNPSSLYPFGNQLGQALDQARSAVATLIGARRPSEILFTSGGTESNTLAIQGLLRARPEKRHIITSAVEHSSILSLCEDLSRTGYRITYLPVDAQGQLKLADLEAAICVDTALVTVMWANNETGVLFPLKEIADCCAKHAIPLHSDAIQAVGKTPIDLDKIPVQVISISGHKFHAPKGIGALYIRRGTQWQSPLPGAQEHGRRAGTENVAGIVGIGKAAELASEYLNHSLNVTAALRDQLEAGLKAAIGDLHISGATNPRLANTSNIQVADIDGEACVLLLAELGICVSTGSACGAGKVAASHVLQAMGVNLDRYAPIRLTLGRNTPTSDVQILIQRLPEVVARLRRLNPNFKPI